MPSTLDSRRRLLRVLPAVVGVVLAYTSVTGVAWAAGGTPVCGAVPAGQSVWTAAGSPYVICASGAEIGPGAAVVINGQLGPVDVLGAGAGGLLVDGGTLQTTLTSDAASATFAADASNPDSKWGGVTVKTGDNNTKPTLAIDHASFSDAEIGLQA